MSEDRILYQFRASSQILFYTMLRGRRVRIKFSLPYEGVARYNTEDALMAQKIRESEQFISGRIIEDEPIVHVEPVVVEEPKPKKKEPSKRPSWTMGAMTTDIPNSNKASAKEAEAKALEQGESTRDQQPKAKETKQQNLFSLKAEDVDSYMAAKEYLREQGAETSQIKNKSLMQQYCAENGIEFPNYGFD